MKAISSHYNQICVQKYQPLGFIKSKKTFARIRGDILQAFSLKFSRDMPTCTVEFGVFPLCLPQPVFLDAGGYDLDGFIIEQNEGTSGWAFDPGSDESMINCCESISNAIDLYLLPFFETCSDSKSALSELIRLEVLFDYNRQKRLQLIGGFDSAVPWQERSLYDPRKYYMALKSHNISYASQFLNHQIYSYKSTLKSFDEPNSPMQPDSVKRRFLTKLSMYLEQNERLDSGDFGYFDDLLNANENLMQEFLATKHPSIFRKYVKRDNSD